MSKLKLNNSILDFLKRNKIRICALSMCSCIMTGGILLQNIINENKNSSITQNEERIQSFNQLKKRLELNSTNIEVIKNDNGWYKLIDYNYKETPIYTINEDGERIIVGFIGEPICEIEYSFSAKKANELGLTELLESKINKNSKTK